MTVVSVEHALAGKIPEGGEVTVRGWVRTVRGSANLAFVNVSDGSCFARSRSWPATAWPTSMRSSA